MVDANGQLFRKQRSQVVNLVKFHVDGYNSMKSSNLPESEYLCIPGERSI